MDNLENNVELETTVSEENKEVQKEQEPQTAPTYTAEPIPKFDPQTGEPMYNFDPFTGEPLVSAEKANKIEQTAEDASDAHENVYVYTSEPPIAAPVEITLDEKNYNSRKGLKIFAIVLALILAFSGCVGFGYILGNSIPKISSGNSTPVKPIIEFDEADENALSLSKVYEKVNPSIVGIMVYNTAGGVSSASGVIMTEDGYIITNDHIYSEVASPKFIIYMHDGKEFDAEYVGGDTRSDVAVLKITNLDKKLIPASFADSDNLLIGQKVAAVGRPMDATLSSNITEGIISLLNVRVTVSSSYSNKVIQTDTAINPGSSGGALVNAYGQVVGITSAKIVGNEYEGIGYAIPTKTVKKVAESLVQHGKVVNRAKLGISYQAIDSLTIATSEYDTTGLLVAEVTNSNLTSYLKKGDIIVSIDNQKIVNADIVLDVIENALPGDTINLGILRDGKGEVQTINAKLLADEGTSSLDTSAPKKNNDDSFNNGSSFTFPFGD